MTRTEGEITTNTDPTGPWSLVVPLKPLAGAKSRLGPAVGGDLRPRLALAFAQDTVSAALACRMVRDVVVVTDDAVAAAALAVLGARAVADTPAAGLNAALEHGARSVRARRGDAALAVLNADLPALRPDELARVLEFSAEFPRAFVSDAQGIGTTFLSAAPGVELRPAFGGTSRARHLASGAVEVALPGLGSVRRDVDTGGDLEAALALGVGRFTAGLTAPVAPAADR
ncbi:2-phospho-L-lactate guanylyltransferase [Streptomyces sp. NRRL S-4]|uniref:2-phospho-L-lactate guanylyltransferase n=1 Tax=Streptomyces sp. NRRL S-4 TaxID=1519471 RepID=UPI0006B4347C|nr:2-phospho-L-lactate guanylyltransferase [Streptomyces sp. NRRL S-4]KPC83800.1 2-phospho-L-lactate guanylyltransferase [Streptomyces sp. NRRL S-4]